MKNLWTSIFFGNYFYGLCAVALSIEASLQQGFRLNNLLFYLLVFFGTVVYYTKAYIQAEQNEHHKNHRAEWYAYNQPAIRLSQIIYTISIFIVLMFYYTNNSMAIKHLHLIEIFLLLIFPFIGILYYGLENYQNNTIQLRQVGWLKPFIIGFCWAGVVTIYPILYFKISHTQHFQFSFFTCLLFIKNFMFIAVLSIMFDIKDYATDSNQQLKTFVVKYGLRQTIFYIIIPLSLLGLSSFLTYAFSQHFSTGRIGLNIIPFLLILIVSFSLQKRKSIFYYLAIIDGLMLVKGLCGSAAMLYF